MTRCRCFLPQRLPDAPIRSHRTLPRCWPAACGAIETTGRGIQERSGKSERHSHKRKR